MIDLDRRALQVAPDLLGAHLTSRIGGEQVTVRIVEVEAYEGADDPASHAFRGERPRNRVMFGPPGHLYVYRHMGLHHCTNVVVGPEGIASAVLLRGAQVIDGLDVAWRRRLAAGVCRTDRDLARGPARLAVVLGLTRDHDGVALGSAGSAASLWLEPGPTAGEPVASGPRIGIAGAGEDAASRPWRFWLADDPHVSGRR
ncbi:DNA-3-methyladenine glycosylase [Pseudactinotalea terrae]|uniref:DNA-3-methyladenine glycosylase n=1 Tax=Pseudactinotalea terrae TaxID=1743262 RepID=UPI0012E1CBA5|nr:DNA-3-methyladenine glycosylase [Pseudactinotalea terrae]